MNPCPCGFLGHYSHPCRCGDAIVAQYRARISGPLLDRIDLHVSVPALPPEEMDGAPRAESSQAVRLRVCAARERQLRRQGVANARLGGREVEERSHADAGARTALRNASARMSLSARAHQRVLKVSRTIADLEGHECVIEAHVAEALGYRGEPVRA